jgi:hypothetical protein
MLRFDRKKRLWCFCFGDDIHWFKTYDEALKFAAIYEWELQHRRQ